MNKEGWQVYKGWLEKVLEGTSQLGCSQLETSQSQRDENENRRGELGEVRKSQTWSII